MFTYLLAGRVVVKTVFVCLQYMSLMAELGQGPPPPSNGDKATTSFSRALPMLGARQPVLGLPPPNVSRFMC